MPMRSDRTRLRLDAEHARVAIDDDAAAAERGQADEAMDVASELTGGLLEVREPRRPENGSSRRERGRELQVGDSEVHGERRTFGVARPHLLVTSLAAAERNVLEPSDCPGTGCTASPW